jgi:hypothetical protein
VKRRDHAGDAGLLAEGGVPGDVAEETDRGDGQPCHRERVAQRHPEHGVEVRPRLASGNEEVLVPEENPEPRRGEARVEGRVPGREEAPERAVLQVDVVPSVEEEPEDEAGREQGKDQVVPPGARLLAGRLSRNLERPCRLGRRPLPFALERVYDLVRSKPGGPPDGRAADVIGGRISQRCLRG